MIDQLQDIIQHVIVPTLSSLWSAEMVYSKTWYFMSHWWAMSPFTLVICTYHIGVWMSHLSRGMLISCLSCHAFDLYLTSDKLTPCCFPRMMAFSFTLLTLDMQYKSILNCLSWASRWSCITTQYSHRAISSGHANLKRTLLWYPHVKGRSLDKMLFMILENSLILSLQMENSSECCILSLWFL